MLFALGMILSCKSLLETGKCWGGGYLQKHAGACREEDAISSQVSKLIHTIPGTMEGLKEEKLNPFQAWQR